MKNFISNILLFGCFLFILSSCADSKEKAVKDFAVHFGEMVQNKDASGIKAVYADAGDIDKAHLTFYRDKIDIFPEENDKYKIRYGDGAYIIVKIGLNNAMEVVDSHGIFESQDSKKKNSKVDKDESKVPSIEEAPKKRNRNSVSYIDNGWHTFTGSLNFKGADYGFEIRFDYNADTRKATKAIYEATGTGSTNKINSFTFSDDESRLKISGPSLEIEAKLGVDGLYHGTMTRGTHSGKIVMSLY